MSSSYVSPADHHVCSDGDVRLLHLLNNVAADQVMNSSRYMSLVQVCMTDCWWYMDVASWTNTSAVIACNTLGFRNKPG